MPAQRLAQPTMEPVSLAEAKAHLRVSWADEDALITSYTQAARERCEAHLRRSLIASPWRLTLDAFPDDGLITLPYPPIYEITAVQYLDAQGTQRTIDPADYILDLVSAPGYLAPAPGLAWPTAMDRFNAVTIDYTAGYADAATVPAPIKAWLLLMISALYENREYASERPVTAIAFADDLLDAYRIWPPAS